MSGSPFSSALWWRALHLTERSFRPFPRTRQPALDPATRAPLDRWLEKVGFPDESAFAQRLLAEGIGPSDFAALLQETAESLQERIPDPPRWLNELQQAFGVARNGSESSGEPPGSGLLNLVAPLLVAGRSRLAQGVAKIAAANPSGPVGAHLSLSMLSASLPRQLLMMVSRTAVLEMHVAGASGRLPSGTGAERFAAFCESLTRPEVALALLQEYPVLARVVIQHVERHVDFRLELLELLCADWIRIKAAFSPREEPGPLVRIEGSSGDTHSGGRSVQVCCFASGLRVVYKPRSLAVDQHFQQLLRWINERGWEPRFRPMTVLPSGNHGWSEFIAPTDCTNAEEVSRFYERQGGFVALTYVLEAMDFHSENLIACGEHPVLIDMECLFHPRPQDSLPSAAEQALTELLSQSVLRPGLLPHRMVDDALATGVDISGLGAAPGQLMPRALGVFEASGTDDMHLTRKRMVMPDTPHRPKLRGAEVSLWEHASAVVAGFTRLYGLLLEHRDELLATDGPLGRFAKDHVRVLLRSTESYGVLLDESYHPHVLQNALDRDRLFDHLWVENPHQPHLGSVVPYEQSDLRSGDIPLFTTLVDSRDLWAADGRRIADFFDQSGLELVQERLAGLGEEDLERQSWFVRASLATLCKESAHAQGPARLRPRPTRAVDRATLLSAAADVGRRLVETVVEQNGFANWVGLTHVDHRMWVLNPLGLDLQGGLPGVVLFLATLGELTADRLARETARSGLATMRSQLADNLDTITSIGAFDGWAGLVYLFTHLGRLWGEPALFDEAEQLVRKIDSLVESDVSLDIGNGSAGAIGGLLCLAATTGSAAALRTAIRCGDRLLQGAPPAADAPWPAQSGFLRGTAGIAWALARLARHSGLDRFLEAGSALESARASSRSMSGETNGWCHGAVGIGLARLQRSESRDPGPDDELTAAVHATLAGGFGATHCLCHGDLGNLELWLQASAHLGETRWWESAQPILASVIDDMKSSGWRCATPFGIESPGLMNGLSGIGYQLLRFARPDVVPSVLTIDPPR
jgi:type 2 lantibiotic biosynthesis protein LanM